MRRVAILDDYQNVATQFADWSQVGKHAEATVSNDHVSGQQTLMEDCVLSMLSALNGDKLYGDTAIALLFGLYPAGTLRGLPLQAYLECVHDDDRRDLANAISEAVRSGRPYHAEYRVRNLLGHYTAVIALGRRFEDEHGDPSGVIYPLY